MKMKKSLVNIIPIFVFMLISMYIDNPAFGHGFGYEVLPVPTGKHNATLSLLVNPPRFDPTNNEYEIVVNLADSKTQAVIDHVTYLIEVTKNDKTVFKEKFHDDLGNLYLKVIQNDLEQVTVIGKQDNTIGWMKKDDFNPLRLEGPIFTSAGLYHFNIEILTVDSDDNVLENPATLNAAISLAEKSSHLVTSTQGNQYELGITSYYDQIKDFNYSTEEKKVSFVMPFDWSEENIKQTGIVHQELHIPKTFGELLVTKYDATVNGIPISEKLVTIDDYSEENRIVHVILRPEDILPLLQAASMTIPEMQFTMTPSKQVQFPLSANTANVKYKVDLSWDPPIIKSGENTRFFIDITELYKPKIPAPVTFDFVIKQNGNEIIRDKVSGQLNSQKSNFYDYVFSAENLGPIIISIENINDPYLSSVDFVAVVSPKEQPVQTFPVRVSSSKVTESGILADGRYDVDLTWFPSQLEPGAAEFVMTIYDKESGLPIPEAEYDFVLIQNDQEIYRKSGFTKTGGTFEDFTFFDKNIGQVVLRVENIDGSEEFIEIPISVTPEFPINGMLVLTTVFTSIIVLTRFTKFHE